MCFVTGLRGLMSQKNHLMTERRFETGLLGTNRVYAPGRLPELAVSESPSLRRRLMSCIRNVFLIEKYSAPLIAITAAADAVFAATCLTATAPVGGIGHIVRKGRAQETRRSEQTHDSSLLNPPYSHKFVVGESFQISRIPLWIGSLFYCSPHGNRRCRERETPPPLSPQLRDDTNSYWTWRPLLLLESESTFLDNDDDSAAAPSDGPYPRRALTPRRSSAYFPYHAITYSPLPPTEPV